MPHVIESPFRERRKAVWRVSDCLIERRRPSVWHDDHTARRRNQGSRYGSWREVNTVSTLPAISHQGQRAAVVGLFEALADRWEAETALESVVTRKATHPSYQRIIGMGEPAVPLILRRLEREPRQWFWALTAITGEDPAHGETTAEGASRAWLRWGRERGFVVD
jgi:hypothetical protein